jgi:phosphate:Na+ symporter
LFHTLFNILNTFILVWFIKPISLLAEKIVPEIISPEKAIDVPKFLERQMLEYPETAIASLFKETDYLYRNAIFEIVTHALNIHREDILSDIKAKTVVKKSVVDFMTDVRALYLSKVKTIYGEIIKYATLAQSTLKLTEAQNRRIMQIKLANRKMVEIIRNVGELSRNVSKYLESDNIYIRKRYDNYRKIVITVLRVIFLLRDELKKTEFHEELKVLNSKIERSLEEGSIEIEKLIREDLITTDMASSLVNDHDNVEVLIEKLIEVAQILYVSSDPLLNETQEESGLSHNAA